MEVEPLYLVKGRLAHKIDDDYATGEDAITVHFLDRPAASAKKGYARVDRSDLQEIKTYREIISLLLYPESMPHLKRRIAKEMGDGNFRMTIMDQAESQRSKMSPDRRNADGIGFSITATGFKEYTGELYRYSAPVYAYESEWRGVRFYQRPEHARAHGGFMRDILKQTQTEGVLKTKKYGSIFTPKDYFTNYTVGEECANKLRENVIKDVGYRLIFDVGFMTLCKTFDIDNGGRVHTKHQDSYRKALLKAKLESTVNPQTAEDLIYRPYGISSDSFVDLS